MTAFNPQEYTLPMPELEEAQRRFMVGMSDKRCKMGLWRWRQVIGCEKASAGNVTNVRTVPKLHMTIIRRSLYNNDLLLFLFLVQKLFHDFPTLNIISSILTGQMNNFIGLMSGLSTCMWVE